MTEIALRVARRRRLRRPHPMWWLAVVVVVWACIASAWCLVTPNPATPLAVGVQLYAVGRHWPQLRRPFRWVILSWPVWPMFALIAVTLTVAAGS